MRSDGKNTGYRLHLRASRVRRENDLACRLSLILLPVRQGSPTKKNFGSPCSEINRERNTVAAVTTYDNGICALWMFFEHGSPVLSYKDRASPTMSDLCVEQSRMQTSNAVFQFVQKLRSLTCIDVNGGQFSPILHVDQTTAKDDSILMDEASPQIRQIGGVEGFTTRHAKCFELPVGKLPSSKRHSEFRVRSCGEPGQFERLGVRRKDYVIGANTVTPDVEKHRLCKLDALDLRLFINKDTALGGRLGQTAYHLAGIERAARNLLSETQVSSVGPVNRRFEILSRSIKLVDTGQVEITGNAEITEDGRKSTQYVSQPWQISGGGFGKREPTGMAAGASAKRLCFEEGHASRRIKALRVGCGRQAAKAAPDNGYVNRSGKGYFLRREIYCPRRRSPAVIDFVRQRSAFRGAGPGIYDADGRPADTTENSKEMA